MRVLDEKGEPDASFSCPFCDDASAWPCALQADGKLLIVVKDAGPAFPYTLNHTELQRLNRDGSVDEAFQPDMKGPDSLDPRLGALTVDAEGRIVVGGFQNFVMRLLPDGSRDTSFVRREFPHNGLPSWNINHLVMQPDGRVLVGVWGWGGGAITNVVRLLLDGTIDKTFRAPVWDGLYGISSLILQPDGRILISGGFGISTGPKGRNVRALTRLFPDGQLDPSFESPAPGVDIQSSVLDSEGRLLTIESTLSEPGGTKTLLTRRWAHSPTLLNLRLDSSGFATLFLVGPVSNRFTIHTSQDLKNWKIGETFRIPRTNRLSLSIPVPADADAFFLRAVLAAP
jgi:uncharacterized delta-60 repeat protein